MFERTMIDDAFGGEFFHIIKIYKSAESGSTRVVARDDINVGITLFEISKEEFKYSIDKGANWYPVY